MRIPVSELSMQKRPFRILSLSGGGVRGIFQAVFLRCIGETLNVPLWKLFDLIAGTSTGSIIGMGIALGIDTNRIEEFYKTHSYVIFDKRFMANVRRGPKYDQKHLSKYLKQVFSNKKLADTKTHVLVTASCLDQFQHRVFSTIPTQGTADLNLSAVDVVLCSSAAPTYFSPVKPAGQERTYIDGGLWANSPSSLAIAWAHRYLKFPFESIRLLSVGTGEFPNGMTQAQLESLRPYSPDAIRAIFEIMFSCQASFADHHAQEILGSHNFLRINASLDQVVSLDEVEKALTKLPAYAEEQAQRNLETIKNMFLLSDMSDSHSSNESVDQMAVTEDQLVSRHLIAATGLTGFYPSRDHYMLRGKSASSIDKYVATARNSVVMVSINLMTGMQFDDLCTILRRKLEDTNGKFQVVISLLNPYRDDLMSTLGPSLGKESKYLSDSIKETIGNLLEFQKSLSSSSQERFSVHLHNSIPFGSAIMIDHKDAHGRIQIETKPYKAALRRSFAFEVAPTGIDGLYATIATGYEELLRDGKLVSEKDLKETSKPKNRKQTKPKK
ncbi:MAG: patatin-like phospholipase family protein [Deltaproteobacteria bacterium]|nr:patatin-like phospholipase family protein [Deltaproteobacteria bacterium]